VRLGIGCQRGWTLVELLITASLLIVVLSAVLAIADSTQRQASADDERSVTVGAAQAGLSRMVQELRQGCAIFVPAQAPTSGQYCFNQFFVAPEPTACTRTTDCIDFVLRERTVFNRSGNSVSAISHPLERVRYECAVADPASTSDLPRANCVRYEGSCGINSCPSPTQQTGVLVRSIRNSGSPGAPTNVFRYCTRTDPYTCNLAPTTTVSSATAVASMVDAMKLSLAIARRGTRPTGTTTEFFLQAGFELKNIAPDATGA
jgi:type II secretory pathway pseudopilin PulG